MIMTQFVIIIKLIAVKMIMMMKNMVVVMVLLAVEGLVLLIVTILVNHQNRTSLSVS